MKVLVYKSKKPDTSKLLRDKNGKPLPINRAFFNISHSEDYWAIAVSNKPVGIDLQSKTKQGKPRQLSNRVLQKILKPNEQPVKNSYLHNFVIKEAYSKLTGEGLSIGFSELDANELIKTYHPYHKETKDYILYAFEQQ